MNYRTVFSNSWRIFCNMDSVTGHENRIQTAQNYNVALFSKQYNILIHWSIIRYVNNNIQFENVLLRTLWI